MPSEARKARPAALVFLAAALLGVPAGALAAVSSGEDVSPAWGAFTRYELLEPGTGRFRIVYDAVQDQAGATRFFNPIRKGSRSTEESVIDPASGRPLDFRVVSGAEAQRAGLAQADPASDYIQVDLARPTPPGGASRIRIEKTYEDRSSYSADAGEIRFLRSLGIKRNVVVLPAGYHLVSCNYPVQVGRDPSGRIAISFFNVTPAEAPLDLRAAPGAPPAAPAPLEAPGLRAEQTRDIVYFLKDPATHAFALFHDYTESRPGVGRYVNVVRTGSAVSSPSAVDLDDGSAASAQILKGEAVSRAGLTKEELGADYAGGEVVLFSFRPPGPGGSVRLRMSETYTDPQSYRLDGELLVLRRSLGRAQNAVVLPPGWELTASSAPGRISRTGDGRVRIDLENPGPGDLDVLLTARRAGSP